MRNVPAPDEHGLFDPVRGMESSRIRQLNAGRRRRLPTSKFGTPEASAIYFPLFACFYYKKHVGDV